MSFINNLLIKYSSTQVGVDQFGNRYFITKCKKNYLSNNKRFVLYNGMAETSKIPPMWHSWLHYMSNEIPNCNRKLYDWQKDHTPNLTGTNYVNNIHTVNNKQYSKWSPN